MKKDEKKKKRKVHGSKQSIGAYGRDGLLLLHRSESYGIGIPTWLEI